MPTLSSVPYVYMSIPFLCHLWSIAAHRDHFVWRLSVRSCVCVCLSGSHTFLVVTHSYVSPATHAFLGMLPLCYLPRRHLVWYFCTYKLSYLVHHLLSVYCMLLKQVKVYLYESAVPVMTDAIELFLYSRITCALYKEFDCKSNIYHDATFHRCTISSHSNLCVTLMLWLLKLFQ